MKKTFTFLQLLFILPLLFTFLTCVKQEEGPTQVPEVPNEQLIQEKFDLLKAGFIDRDVSKIMSVISEHYYDPINTSKSALQNWLTSFFSQYEWKASPEVERLTDIEVMPGHAYPENPSLIMPATARFTFEVTLFTSNVVDQRSASGTFSIQCTWEKRDEWKITKFYGTTAWVETTPDPVPTGSEVTLFAFTRPFGAPAQTYDTKEASVSDWEGNPVSLIDQGNRIFQGTLTAPTSAGTYEVTGTLTDATREVTLTVVHPLVVQ